MHLEAKPCILRAEPAPGLEPNPSNNLQMFQIFQNVQYNVVQHKKYVKEMIKLYKKMAETSFRESFKNALYYLFTFGDTSANVDRVVQFVATFCTSLDDEEEFLLFIFDIIFNCQCVSGQSVRYRASQLLAAVLAALGDDASLDDDLCDKLLASQMERIQDTRGAVRCRAALALQRLQNPMEPNDQVTRAYRFHMSCDPSSSVRRAVVMSIAKSVRNVPFVLERLCDVDEAVRRAAFLYIAAINVTQLKVRQRLLTLKVGLNERSPRVRRVVEEILIPGWLSTFKGNIVDLLKAIRLDNSKDAKDSQQVAGKLLESLFKRLPISELLEWLPTDKTLRLIPADKLNKETAWYWRHLAEHLQKIDDDETLETVLPDLVVLTGYIKAIVESPCPPETVDPVGFSTRQYVLHELACLLHAYDAGDQAGRTALQELITDVLTGDYGPMNPDVIRAFVTSLMMVIPEVSQRMEVIAGVISALREPPEVEAPPPVPVVPVESTELKMQRARLRVSLNVAMEAQEEAVREQNYALAEECKAKVQDIQKKLEEMAQPVVQPSPPPPPITTIREKISDSATLNKCLNILNCALDTAQLTTITPMMQLIFNELEVEIFQNPDILETALETVALFGILDKEFAIDNKAFFFAHLIDTSNERVMSTVLRCLLDLLCAHGAKVFEDDDDTQSESQLGKKKRVTCDAIDEDGNLSQSALSMSTQHNTVIEILLKILDTPCSKYRLIIAEGLCRLLYLGHLESSSILSRLLLLWFNPATVDEDMLRQVIGVFFQSFASTVEGAQEQIQKATIPTLRALSNAPSSSPIAEIDQEAVVRFIVSLTRINHELTDSQGSMAMTLCNHLVQRPCSSEAGLICRMLALLSPPRDATIASDLAAMLRDLCLKMPDKQSCRNLTRYLGALELTDRASMNKTSQTGVTEATNGTMQGEDTMSRISRATTSLPQPIARSTHIVINETIEEEVEVNDSSPVHAISKISAGLQPQHNSTGIEPTSPIPIARSSAVTENNHPSDLGAMDQDAANDFKGTDTDSSGVSPVKKAKAGKGKKKKLSIKRDSGSDASTKRTKGKATKNKIDIEKEKESETQNQSENAAGGMKRTRSQRSLDDIERANRNQAENAQPATQVTPSPPDTNVRRSLRSSGEQSSPSSESNGSGGSSEVQKKEAAGGKKKGGKANRNQAENAQPTTQVTPSPPDTNVRRSLRSSGEQSSPSSESNGSGSSEVQKKEAAGGKKKRGKDTKLATLPSPLQSIPSFESDNSEKSGGIEKKVASKGKKKAGKDTKSAAPPSPLQSIPSFESDNSEKSGGIEKKVAIKGKKKGGKVVTTLSPKFDLDSSNVTMRRSPRVGTRFSPSSESYGSCLSTPNQTRAGNEAVKSDKAGPSPKFDLDSSNVTFRRSTRGGIPFSLSPLARKEGSKAVLSPKFDLDSSNVTVRRSTRGGTLQSPVTTGTGIGKTKGGNVKAAEPTSKPAPKSVAVKKSISPVPSPQSSQASLFEDSADETELHTIVYDQELVQSLLDESSELADSKRLSKTGNVTIPETPDASDESASEPEIVNVKEKGKRNGKSK